MKTSKALMFIVFLLVVAINMMWVFPIKTFATDKSPPQNVEPSVSVQQQTQEKGKAIDDSTQPTIVTMPVFLDFVFWKTVGEIVRNLIQLLFPTKKAHPKAKVPKKSSSKRKNRGKKKQKKK